MAKHALSRQREEERRRRGGILGLATAVMRSVLGRTGYWRYLAGLGSHRAPGSDPPVAASSRGSRRDGYVHQNIAWTRKKWYIHIGADVSVFFSHRKSRRCSGGAATRGSPPP